MKHDSTRIELLEAGHRSLTQSVDRIEGSVTKLADAIFAEFGKFRVELATKAQPVQYRAVITSAATAAALMAAFVTLANFWFDAKAQPDRDRQASIQRQVEHYPPALMKYQIDEMTRRLRLLNPSF